MQCRILTFASGAVIEEELVISAAVVNVMATLFVRTNRVRANDTTLAGNVEQSVHACADHIGFLQTRQAIIQNDLLDANAELTTLSIHHFHVSGPCECLLALPDLCALFDDCSTSSIESQAGSAALT